MKYFGNKKAWKNNAFEILGIKLTVHCLKSGAHKIHNYTINQLSLLKSTITSQGSHVNSDSLLRMYSNA